MRLIAFLVALLMSSPACAAERDRSIVVGGLTRQYTLIAPDKGAKLLPLLVVYHGGGQTAERARRYTRFDKGAANETFVVVYPQGLDDNWNDGRVSTDLRQRAAGNADDVEFTAQIIARLEFEGLIDPARVFLAGASNGGMMALRAACELDTRIAGVVSVVANLPVEVRCLASRMPALFIHGTHDAYMPYEGGRVAAKVSRRDLGSVLGAAETIGAFMRINACAGVKDTKTLDAVGRDNTKAVVTSYDCAKAPLKHIVIEGGGHTWPGARESIISELLLGNTSREVDATAETWAFFNSLLSR